MLSWERWLIAGQKLLRTYRQRVQMLPNATISREGRSSRRIHHSWRWLPLMLQPSSTPICGPRISSISITWEFVRNVDSWTPPQTSWIQTWEALLQQESQGHTTEIASVARFALVGKFTLQAPAPCWVSDLPLKLLPPSVAHRAPFSGMSIYRFCFFCMHSPSSSFFLFFYLILIFLWDNSPPCVLDGTYPGSRNRYVIQARQLEYKTLPQLLVLEGTHDPGLAKEKNSHGFFLELLGKWHALFCCWL